jgi:hypothetical protein
MPSLLADLAGFRYMAPMKFPCHARAENFIDVLLANNSGQVISKHFNFVLRKCTFKHVSRGSAGT